MITLKQLVSIPFDRVWNKLRDSKYGHFIKHALTPDQKAFIKKFAGFGVMQARWEVGNVKHHLYQLGFTERGLRDLEGMVAQDENPHLKRLAAFELMMWHASLSSEAGARRCLKLYAEAVKREKDPARLRKACVMKAESLALLGRTEEARKVVKEALETGGHADLCLAAANLESSLPKRVEWINKALRLHGIAELSVPSAGYRTDFDSLVSATDRVVRRTGGRASGTQPKVSVIIPAYNAAPVIRTSLSSALSQTWTNLEVIVVDDASTDETAEIVKDYMDKDERVRFIQAETNGGAYVARNLGLRQCTGEFVMVSDADDWSHPEKIERQARHLIQHPSVIANTSQHSRATDDLQFCRRINSAIYIQANISSLMFRREPVMNTIGYWDSVRFGADGEFKRRLKKAYGDKAVVDLATGPLSFTRLSDTSLTGDSAFGYQGFKMGARKEYAESHDRFHAEAAHLYIDFPLNKRPFSVPEPMKPWREAHPAERRHFDVIIVSDFRLPGGNASSNAEEIKAQKRFGLRTGLIQMARYGIGTDRTVDPKIRQLLDDDDGSHVQMLVYGEKVSCDVLIIRHPPVLEERQKYLPEVDAKQVKVIVNQPPMREYSASGERLYHFDRCEKHLQEFVGQRGTWYPIGPQVRKALVEHHASELQAIELADEDWLNIIDVDEWKRDNRPGPSEKIRIGRHSRDQYVKWPASKEDLRQIYPNDPRYEIHVLGGATAPRRVLGRLPANWRVMPFGAMHPKEFLATLDVFVYFTHPEWVESFGRVIIEAMAVGVPVIVPYVYRDLFGEAAIYAEPVEVKEKIDHLMRDADYYEAQVKKAHAYVERHFGYASHKARLGIGTGMS